MADVKDKKDTNKKTFESVEFGEELPDFEPDV